MSNNVDERVVGMKFDNAQFEQGIKTTLASLDALNKGLKLEGATHGLSAVAAAANGVQLGHISNTVDNIAERFKAMSVVAITALVNIANRAIEAGLQIGRALTVDPINQGLQEYQTNINSIQTILSNTRWQNTGLDDVNEALETLNRYSDMTIYNFSEMARNIGTFTAAGVKLDVAVAAIKGIANLAAVSGSSSQQAANAMYQLSQAIATGTVKLIDWNSVVNAGMGGKVFQDALIQTARVHGIAIDQIIKDQGSFRASLEKGWLSAEILTETLNQFTGDMTEAQLISMGYTQQQAADIIAMGKDAQDAATKVKTITQLFSTLQETAGSGWAKTWQIIFGDFEEARSVFTDVNDVLSGLIQKSADARNELLTDWKEMGGRTVLIEALSNAFHALIDFITPFRDTFREFFPAVTAKQLYDITVAVRDFFANLKLGHETMDQIQRIFAGVLAVFSIAWQVIKQVAGVFFDLFGVVSEGSGGILEFTAKIGDFLVGLNRAVIEGQGLQKFFEGLGKVLSVPIKMVQALGVFLATLFDGFDAVQAGRDIGGLVENLSPMERLGNLVLTVWNNVIHAFDEAWHMFEPLATRLSNFFHMFGDQIAGFTKDMGFGDLLGAINTGAFVTLVGFLVTLLGQGGRGGLLWEMREAMGEVTTTLNTMQNTLRAATLLEIAIALGVMAAAVSVLSKIDANGLERALSALTIMFGQLILSLAVLERMPFGGTARLYGITTGLILLGLAVKVLASAVEDLSELNWSEMTRGLTGVVVLLAALVAAANFMPDGARLISAGIGLVVIAVAVKVLASAVADIAELDWGELAKGLVGVGVLLASLAIFTRIAGLNSTGIAAGAGLLLLSVGIRILADALTVIADISWANIAKGVLTMAAVLTMMTIALDALPPSAIGSAAGMLIAAVALVVVAQVLETMGAMSWGEIGKAMVAMFGSLVMIALALDIIPPSAILSAAAILVTAAALVVIAEVLETLGDMSWGAIGKAMVALISALTIVGIAATLMVLALPGAFAMTIIAAALVLLTGVLVTLGGMSWGDIATGLGALALAFTVLGVAGLLLYPVVPALLALGGAIALIGAGLALAGAGVFLFATGLTALSVAGAAGTAAMVAMLSAVIGLIPLFVEQVGIALLLLIDVLIAATPKIVELLITLIVMIIDGLIVIMPKIYELFVMLLDMILDLLVEFIPKIVDAGVEIILGLLRGLRDNIPKIVHAAVEVIVAFLKSLGDELPKITDQGFKTIIAFIDGITKAIEDNSEEMGRAGGDLAVAIIKGMVTGLGSGVNQVVTAAKNVAKSALNAAKSWLGIASPSKEFALVGRYSDEGLAQGLNKYADVVEQAGRGVGKTALSSVRDSLNGMSAALSGEINMQPVITPVLDLTSVEEGAGRLGTLLATKPIKIDTSVETANAAGAGREKNEDALAEEDLARAGDIYNFTQNNTSPKALSQAEIYRQTNNQLSTIKRGGTPK